MKHTIVKPEPITPPPSKLVLELEAEEVEELGRMVYPFSYQGDAHVSTDTLASRLIDACEGLGLSLRYRVANWTTASDVVSGVLAGRRLVDVVLDGK